MAEVGLRARLERHVELFNEAVRTGNYAPLLTTFAESAVMRFDHLALGPYHGKAEIAAAYATCPPADTIALIDMQESGPDSVRATFEWDAGGTGEMFVRWSDAGLIEMVISDTAAD